MIYIKPIRILNYIPAFSYGGIETLVMNLYSNINRDKVQFDFLVEIKPPSNIEKKVNAMGGNFIQIPKMTVRGNLVQHIKAIYNVFKTNKYKVIHIHSFDTRPFVMIVAYLCGVDIRIVHSHSTNFNDKKFIFIKKLVRNISVFLANEYFACSMECAIYMFGEKNAKNTVIIDNGIDLDSYYEDNDVIKKYKNELGLKEELIIGLVGRFSYLKNQIYAIKIAKRLKEKNIKFRILMIGDGETKAYFEKKVIESNLEKYIYCLGFRNDVRNLLHIMDILIMPSINEGVPLTVIEAQALGIKCLVSDNISRKIKIIENVKFISLNNIDEWVLNILEPYKKVNIKLSHKLLKKAGYDIKDTAKRLEEYYIKKFRRSY